jgi:hypothetical protein
MEEQTQSTRSGGCKPPRVAIDLEDAPKRRMIPVWFFVGVILLCYGLIIVATGIYELSHPPDTRLAGLHPAVWWGALLTVIGGIYTYTYAPRRR